MQTIVGESFQCRDESAPNLFLAICLCIRVGVRYRVVFSGHCTGLWVWIGIGVGIAIAIAISITGVTWFRGSALGSSKTSLMRPLVVLTTWRLGTGGTGDGLE
jgi:hypothetical protein